MVSVESHIEEIERVAEGVVSTRDPLVLQSWLRCLNDYKFDPAIAQDAYVVPHTTLREHQEQTRDLIRIGRSGLETLFDQVAEQNYVVLLSDARGVAVDFMGDPFFDRELRRTGLYLGADWSEDRAGTCAVGACMVSGEPVVIHQDDHFDTTHIGLTCTAAPIFDTFGDLAAVLDISQLRSPVAKTSQQLALHLVCATARRIELANLMARTGDDWVLRLARSPDFLDIDPDAAISLDASGRITGITRGGYEALARTAGLDSAAPRQLIGQPISRVFDLDIDDLPRLMRGRPPGERVLCAHDEPVLFANAIAPAANFRKPCRSPMPVPYTMRELSFGDPAMEALQTRAIKLAARHIPILINGETGTGKEYLARAIHDGWPNAGRFVAVNCAAIPEHLIESELFGYVPNAFTGAAKNGKTGLIQAADGGTLFLDEIGDMPLALQARLLRVLSENEVVPVGALEPRPVRSRLLSASHQRLEDLVAEGRFREDLFYRLNAATLTLPPLRARRDFDALVDRMLARIGGAQDTTYRLAAAARTALRRHVWPGNLRELRNALQVSAALCDAGVISRADLPETVQEGSSSHDDLESQLLGCDGNVSALARKIGVNRSTVHRWLKRRRAH